MKKIISILLSALVLLAVTYNEMYLSQSIVYAADCQHEFSEWGIEADADCTQDGMIIKYCNLCGYEQITITEKAWGHDYGEWVIAIPSTCLSEGLEERICANNCNDKLTRVIEKKEHIFKNGMCTGCGFCLGDINLDKHINIIDLILLKESLLEEAQYDKLADINEDSAMDSADFILLKKSVFIDF